MSDAFRNQIKRGFQLGNRGPVAAVPQMSGNGIPTEAGAGTGQVPSGPPGTMGNPDAGFMPAQPVSDPNRFEPRPQTEAGVSAGGTQHVGSMQQYLAGGGDLWGTPQATPEVKGPHLYGEGSKPPPGTGGNPTQGAPISGDAFISRDQMPAGTGGNPTQGAPSAPRSPGTYGLREAASTTGKESSFLARFFPGMAKFLKQRGQTNPYFRGYFGTGGRPRG